MGTAMAVMMSVLMTVKAAGAKAAIARQTATLRTTAKAAVATLRTTCRMTATRPTATRTRNQMVLTRAKTTLTRTMWTRTRTLRECSRSILATDWWDLRALRTMTSSETRSALRMPTTTTASRLCRAKAYLAMVTLTTDIQR